MTDEKASASILRKASSPTNTATKPRTKTDMKEKLASSPSMQRAIDRVSKERNVSNNSPKSVQKKTKVVTTSKVSSPKAADFSKVKSKVTTTIASPRTSATATAASRPAPTKARNSPTKHLTLNATKKSPVKKGVQPAKIGKTADGFVLSDGPQLSTLFKEKIAVDIVEHPFVLSDGSQLSSIDESGVPVDIVEQPEDDGVESITMGCSIETVDTNMDIDIEKKASTISATRTTEEETPRDEEGRDARDITRKMISDILRDGNDELCFEFQGCDVPVSYSASVTYDMATMALDSSPFMQWQTNMSRAVGTKRLEVRHVEIQSVDFIDDRVDMIKMNTACVLIDEELQTEEEVISGVCYLRDNYVALLIELVCIDDETSWSLLVDHPR